MKKYNGFKKFYVNDKRPGFANSAILAAIFAAVFTIIALLFFEDKDFLAIGVIALISFLSFFVLLALVTLPLSISKIYVNDTEIIISLLKKESNGRYVRNDLKEIFLGERLVTGHAGRSNYTFLKPYMVLCFGDGTETRRSRLGESLTCEVYIQLCTSSLKINAVSLPLNEELLTELMNNFCGEIIEGVKPALE